MQKKGRTTLLADKAAAGRCGMAWMWLAGGGGGLATTPSKEHACSLISLSLALSFSLS